MFLILVGAGVLWVFGAVWMKSHGIGETAIGVLMGVGGAVAAVMGLFWGWLSDRTGRTTAIVTSGCVLTGLSLLVLSRSQRMPGFCLYQLLVATGMPAILNTMPLLALTVLADSRQGKGYAHFRVFGSVGYLVALYVLAAVIPGKGPLFAWASGLTLLSVIPLNVANIRTKRHSERTGFSGLLRHRRFLWFAGAVFFASLGGPAVFTFLALYADEIGMDQTGIARLLGMCGVTALVALPLMGSLADRFGRRWILFLGFLAMPVRVLLQGLATGPAGLYVAQLLHILTWAGPETAAYSYITDLVGDQDRGIAISVYLTTRTVSGLVANPLIGYVAEHHGYRTMFGTVACLAAIGCAVFVLGGGLSRPPSRPATE